MKETVISDVSKEEATALSYLPDRLRDAVKRHAALYGGLVNEIRLRCRGLLSITVAGQNVSCNITVSEKECNDTLMMLCGNSLYSHMDTMTEGFITTQNGIRAGVCGKAVCENGVIKAVANVGYICIRIPRRVAGAGDTVYSVLRDMDFAKGAIVWSKPGIGKTTLLRELAIRLGTGNNSLRVAVIDTRHELGYGINDGLIDVLDGYPRAEGMEIARRTMSPEVIICDEISSLCDTDAILNAAAAGIPVVASAHAGSLQELFLTEYIKPIVSSGCIGAYIGLLKQIKGGYDYDIHISNADGADKIEQRENYA